MAYSHYDYDEVLQFIVDYKTISGGDSPSFREIGDHFGMSTSVVKYILVQIQVEGKIELPEDQRARFIKVVGGEWKFNG